MKTRLLVLASFLSGVAHAAVVTPEMDAPHFPQAEYVFPEGLAHYVAGTIVEHRGRLFECKSGQAAGFCVQWSESANQYEPGVGFASDLAWTEITPERSEGVDYHFNYPEHIEFYGPGTIVEHNGSAFRCKPFPYSGFCKQWNEGSNEYEPGVGWANENAWDRIGLAGDKIEATPY